MIKLNKNPSPAELRTFGIGMLIGCGILGAFFWWAFPALHAWWTGHAETPSPGMPRMHNVAIVFWVLGAAMFALALFSPRPVARGVYVVWMTVAIYIGLVTTPVFFTLLFVLLLPIFSFIRLSDPLRKKLISGPGSYWENHKQHDSTIERAMRPF